MLRVEEEGVGVNINLINKFSMNRLIRIESELRFFSNQIKNTTNHHLKSHLNVIESSLKSIQEIILCVENKQDCIEKHEEIIKSHTNAIKELNMLESIIEEMYKE